MIPKEAQTLEVLVKDATSTVLRVEGKNAERLKKI
jgi:hypothetical protein